MKAMTRPSTGSRHSLREQRSSMRNWSDLPDGPLHTILTCLHCPVDFISFSGVCSWRVVSFQAKSLLPPLLLCPTFSGRRRITSIRLLDPTTPAWSFSLSRNSDKFASVKFNSFYHGHFLRLSEYRIVILNPFTGIELFSPFVPKDCRGQFFFPMLTSPLSSPESGILLFTSDFLFYWKIGSSSWSRHDPKIKPAGKMTVVTVQGKVYAMDARYNLFVIDISPKFRVKPLAVEVIGERNFCLSLRHFLVECGGELLHLLVVPPKEKESTHLEVFQLDTSLNQASWVKKENLGNWAIFVGYDNRVPGLAVENPERWGGKRNCVYFAKGKTNGDEPWAVIELENGIGLEDDRDSPLYHGKFRHQLSAVWFCPGFVEMR